MKFFTFLNDLSLKSIIAINIFLTILVLIPLTIYLSQRQTKITGKAYLPAPTAVLVPPSPTPTPLPITPSGPPEITSVFPFYGKVGDAVIIFGKNFGNQKDLVFFGDISAIKIKSWTDNKIHVLVPAGATSGLIKVKSAISPYNFIVFDKNTLCEVFFEETAVNKKTVGVRTCPLFSRARLILEIKDKDLVFGLKPEGSLSFENLKVEKEVVDEKTKFKVEVNVPNNLYLGKILTVEMSTNRKFTLLSVELWQKENLIPFFVNPLNLTQ